MAAGDRLARRVCERIYGLPQLRVHDTRYRKRRDQHCAAAIDAIYRSAVKAKPCGALIFVGRIMQNIPHGNIK
jgi:hypothetical protein